MKQRQGLNTPPPAHHLSQAELHFFIPGSSINPRAVWGVRNGRSQSVYTVYFLPLLPPPHTPSCFPAGSVGCSSCQGSWSSAFPPFSQALLQGCFSHVFAFRRAKFCPFTEVLLASPVGSAWSYCGSVAEPSRTGWNQHGVAPQPSSQRPLQAPTAVLGHGHLIQYGRISTLLINSYWTVIWSNCTSHPVGITAIFREF